MKVELSEFGDLSGSRNRAFSVNAVLHRIRVAGCCASVPGLPFLFTIRDAAGITPPLTLLRRSRPETIATVAVSKEDNRGTESPGNKFRVGLPDLA
jgi:hypothetical protein